MTEPAVVNGSANVSVNGGFDSPAEWQRLRMAEVVSEVMSGDWGAEASDPQLTAALVMRGTDFRSVGRGNWEGVPLRYVTQQSLDKRKLRPGDLVVEISGGSDDQPTGRALLLTPDLLRGSAPGGFSNFLKRVRFDPTRADPAFFAFLWSYLYSLGRTRPYEKRTTGIRNFKLADFLENEFVSVPELHEQVRTASLLQAIVRAIAATRRVGDAAERVHAGVLRHLFGSRRENAAASEDAEREHPAHWSNKELRSLVLPTSQVSPSKEPSCQIEYVDVSSVSSVSLSIHHSTRYTGATAPGRARKQIRKDDVLFATVRPALRRVARVPAELDGAVASTAFCVIRPNSELVDPAYVFYAIAREEFVSAVARHQHGSSYPAVTDRQVLGESIPLPPLDEQRTIAATLSASEGKVRAERRKERALELMFEAVLADVMTGRRRLTGEEPR